MTSTIAFTPKSFSKAKRHNDRLLRNYMLRISKLDLEDFYVISMDQKKIYKRQLMSSLRKVDDYIGAAIAGALVVDAKDGVDAYKIMSGELVGVEVKCCLKDHQNFELGPNDGLNQKGTGKKKKSLSSSMSASFEIINNLQHKNVPTFFVVFDERTRQFIDGYMLDGAAIVGNLTGKKGAKRKVQFNTFRDLGTRVSNRYFPQVGFDTWKEEIRTRLHAAKYGA